VTLGASGLRFFLASKGAAK